MIKLRTVLLLLLTVSAGVMPLGARAEHWAFKKPARPPIPKIKQTDWVKNPVDAFILQRLEQRGIAPSPRADKLTLLRRVTFDLTGLPPTPEEMTAFLADTSPLAYEKVVRRLLSSKRFGERWAQHWLDVVRFAESNGYEHDLDRPQAWRYRDWIVDALNTDKPYNRFIQEQVAGDLLAPDDFNSHVATGFLRAGPFHITGGNLDPDEMRQEWLTETVNGIGNGILGLTIGCARCHDHKFDPIPQTDYYRLQAFFAPVANQEKSLATDAEKANFAQDEKAVKERMKPIEAQVAEIEKPYRAALREQKMQKLPPEYRAALAVEASKRTPEQKKYASLAGTLLNISWDEVVNALGKDDRDKRTALRQKLFALERELPAPLPAAEGVGDSVQPVRAMHLLVRGDVHNPGQEVNPGFPVCLFSSGAINPNPKQPNPRLDLAEWLTSPDNPLTSRVIVNRVWHALFGRGLVSTPNDFGKNGKPPTHPELLDWLATTFMQDSKHPGATVSPDTATGLKRDLWKSVKSVDSSIGCGGSLKALISLVVTSSTYQQACLFDKTKAATDPENLLLWRMNRKRLDAEEMRDSILAANGTLNLETGGPSIRVPLEPEVYDTIFTESEPDNLWSPTPDTRQYTRRSLYLFRKRNVRLPMFALFDQPDMMSSCAARGQTVHALQALTLVNSEFMRKQSYLLANRLMREGKGADRERVQRLFILVLGRPPRGDELRATMKFLADQTALMQARMERKEAVPAPAELPPGSNAASFLALSDLCLATLNLNEFVFIR